VIELLVLILGLLGGFYARTLLNYTRGVYNLLKDKIDSHNSGVVRTHAVKATRSQPINLQSDTGGVRRMTPDEVLTKNMIAREERLKRV
jgi:hypothetical protein